MWLLTTRTMGGQHKKKCSCYVNEESTHPSVKSIARNISEYGKKKNHEIGRDKARAVDKRDPIETVKAEQS